MSDYNHDDTPDHHDDVVVEKQTAKVKPPRRYKVILLNDDYTPMDFVVLVLEQFFAFSREKSVRIMLQVHMEGKGLCGVFVKDVAETKAMQINTFANNNQHPLKCITEKE